MRDINEEIANILAEAQKILDIPMPEPEENSSDGKIIGMFPPGKYFVGDPCYVLDHNDETLDGVWSTFCALHDFDGSAIKIGNIIMGSVSTEYGDGYYDGFLVDSGTLGAATIDHLSKAVQQKLFLLGEIHDFPSEFHVHRRGTAVVIGHITIETGDIGDDW